MYHLSGIKLASLSEQERITMPGEILFSQSHGGFRPILSPGAEDTARARSGHQQAGQDGKKPDTHVDRKGEIRKRQLKTALRDDAFL